MGGWAARRPLCRLILNRHKGPVKLSKGDIRQGMKSFILNEVPDNLQLRILAHGDVSVYLNGKLVLQKFIQTKRHYDEVNLSAYSPYLQRGENQVVVELNKVAGNSFFDFGLYTF